MSCIYAKAVAFELANRSHRSHWLGLAFGSKLFNNCSFTTPTCHLRGKGGANYLRQQEISDLLTECCRLKSQQSAALTQGVLADISWLAAAQAGKRFVTQRESAMPSTCTLYESDLDSGVDMHVLGQILVKADYGRSESVVWIISMGP